MKKSLIWALCTLLLSSPLYADEIAAGLPETVNEQIRNNTREMVREGMPEEDAVKMTRSMIEHRFRNENLIQAQEVVKNTYRQGLPPGPVVNKAHEGMAKNVPDGAIVQAMERTRSQYAFGYSRAREFSDSRAQQQRIGKAIAESLAAGLTQADCDRIRDRLRDRKQDQLHDKTAEQNQDRVRDRDRDRVDVEALALEAFQTARAMARLGVSSSSTGEVVCQALKNRYSASEMQQLQAQFSNQTRSRSGEQLARRYAAAIEKGNRAGNLGSLSGSGLGGSSKGGGTGGSGGSGGGPGGGSGGGGSGGGSGGSGGGGGSGGSGGGGGGKN